MGSPPSAAQTRPWPRPRQSRAPWPEARSSESAVPWSRPCRTGTAAPELKHSEDPPLAPWFASATHGASPYPQPQPSRIPPDPFSRSPYYLALTSVREADVEGVLDAQDERDVPLRKRRHPGRADELPISNHSGAGGLAKDGAKAG